MSFVLDASITMSWHFEDELTSEGEALLGRALAGGIVVPFHWRAEIANAALSGERRGRASAGQTARFTELLDTVETEVDLAGAEHVFGTILPLARAHRLTVYDAIYLELAERRGLPLASLDAMLIDAARSVGVEVLP